MEPYVHKVHYYETDKMGVVHHSNYIRWFEEARSDFFDSIDASYKDKEEKGFISPVISVSCKYRKPCYHGEKLFIYVTFEKYGNVKFSMSYKVVSCESGELKAQGESEHCFVNTEGRVTSLKKEWPAMHERLAHFEGATTENC